VTIPATVQQRSEIPEGLMNYPVVTAELQTANVAYFQRRIQLSGFSAYPVCSPSRLIRTSGVPLYLKDMMVTWR